MKSLLIALATVSLPAVAQAQTAPTAPAPTGTAAPAAGAQTATGAQAAAATPTVGATVVDASGAQVGTIDTVTAQAVLINTGTTKVGVAPQSLASGPKGLTIGMTKAQLDAAGAQQQQQAAAALQSKLTAGTTVTGLQGAQLGKIKSADAQFVTVTTAKGDVKLPIGGFAPSPTGVVVGLTQAQLDQATGGAAAGASTGATATDAGATGTATTGAATTDATAETTTTTTTTKKTKPGRK